MAEPTADELLLAAVRNYLDITWEDEDEALTGLISRGQAYLNNLVGADLDFVIGLPLSLLMDYCRYVYNNASEYFEENFAGEILRLQLQTGVEQLPTDEVAP